MSSPSSLSPSAVVTRLRSAGCVFAEDEAQVLISAAATPGQLTAMVERRVAGSPLEHVVGWAEFCGLRVAVEPGVFVPRRRTEFLAERAIALARIRRPEERGGRSGLDDQPGGRDHVRNSAPRTVVVDLCCGTGAVGVALAVALGPVDLHAADIDPAAVRCARRNVAAVGVPEAQVYEGDLCAPLPVTLRGRVDVLVANVPYVPSDEVRMLPTEARDHEALLALDGGADGLDVLRRVVVEATRWLAPGGHVLFETSERQVRYAAEAVARAGLIPQVATCDERYATVVAGSRPQ